MPNPRLTFLGRIVARLAGPSAGAATRMNPHAQGLDRTDDPAHDEAERPAEPPRLLARMMTAHGVVTSTFALHHPVQVRTMIRACAACTCQKRCETDLDRGVAQATAAEYCPNCDRFR